MHDFFVHGYCATIIVYDERKRLSNLAKHGLDFAELGLDFFERAIVARGGGESRLLAIGLLPPDEAVAVVFTLLVSEAISVVSMQPASRRERRLL